MDDNFLQFTLNTAQKAGQVLLSNFRKDLPQERGTGKGVKIEADILADNIIKSEIEKSFPEHSLLTEETGLIDKKSDYIWVVDPLDGTRNFASHNPFFAVSIALFKNKIPIVGVIDAPFLQERFWAELNKGAYREDLIHNKKEKAQVSNVDKIENSYYIFCEGGETQKGKISEDASKLLPQTFDLRKLGSAALEMAWVGTGRAETYITRKIPLWDIAAGLLFVKEAGGKNMRLDGQEYEWEDFWEKDDFDLVASNGLVKTQINAD